jgi:hypothetical protein
MEMLSFELHPLEVYTLVHCIAFFSMMRKKQISKYLAEHRNEKRFFEEKFLKLGR